MLSSGPPPNSPNVVYDPSSSGRQSSTGPPTASHEASQSNGHRRSEGITFYDATHETPEPLARRRSSRMQPHPPPRQTAEPERMAGITDAVAPQPIQEEEQESSSSTPWRKEQSLEAAEHKASYPGYTNARRRSSRMNPHPRPHQTAEPERMAGITDAVAPQPIQEEEQESSSSTLWRKEQSLEAAEHKVAYPVYTNARVNEHEYPKALAYLYTFSYLIFFAILGTLARLGTQWLTFYPGAPVVFPNLWANFGGTLVMGFLSEDTRLLHHDAKTRKSIPLFIGLSTGFCGSFTSFSTFIRDVFFALANKLPAPDYHPPFAPNTPLPSHTRTLPRVNGYSVNATLAVIILSLAASVSALYIGAHIALFLQPIIPRFPPRLLRRIIDPLAVFLGFGSWLAALFLAIFPPDRPSGPSSRGPWSHETWRGDALFAILFAPVGCLARWYASAKLNPLVPSFPLGTFSVNMLGTAVLGMVIDFQRVPLKTADGAVGGGLVACQALQGVADGFCGCLTTVSTFVVEITSLRRGHGWVYGGTSVLAGLALGVVVMGSVLWSVGWGDAGCKTSNV